MHQPISYCSYVYKSHGNRQICEKLSLGIFLNRKAVGIHLVCRVKEKKWQEWLEFLYLVVSFLFLRAVLTVTMYGTYLEAYSSSDACGRL